MVAWNTPGIRQRRTIQMRRIVLLVLPILVVSMAGCGLLRDKGWGEESALNGHWTGWMRTGSGNYATMTVKLKDGDVSLGTLEFTYVSASNIVGTYLFDGARFEMDFDNESSDFKGTGSSSALSGDRLEGGVVDGTFSLTKD
jgi:hypothetical protein